MATVLVVDDDATIRDTLYDLLSVSHLCHTAATADEALEWLSTSIYDVMLTDISMPGLNGVELLALVRQVLPATPVIIITGIDDREYARGLINIGAFDYLTKPFRLEDVEASVARAIEHRQQLLRDRQRPR